MVSAKALAKQLSVLEIPDRPCIIVYRSADPVIDFNVWEAVCEALRVIGNTRGYLVTLLPGDDLSILSDEDLDRMGLQWKSVVLTEESEDGRA